MKLLRRLYNVERLYGLPRRHCRLAVLTPFATRYPLTTNRYEHHRNQPRHQRIQVGPQAHGPGRHRRRSGHSLELFCRSGFSRENRELVSEPIFAIFDLRIEEVWYEDGRSHL